MFKTVAKIIGWLFLFCIVLIGGWFTIKILMPSLAATPPTAPAWKIEVTPREGRQQVAFTPDGKQILDLYFNDRNYTNGIRRWDAASGKELPPIKSQEDFFLLSKNGLFYMTTDKKENASPKMRVYSVSNQKLIAKLPDLSTRGKVVRMIGNDPLIATLDIGKPTAKDNDFIKRSYSFWGVSQKKYIQNNPHNTAVYEDFSINPDDVTFSDDGTKVFSLWPVFTITSKRKPAQFAEGLDPWPDSSNHTPKEAWLLNELTGKVTKLPFAGHAPELQWVYRRPDLSKDGKLFAMTTSSTVGGWNYNGQDGSVFCYDLPNQKLRWKYFKAKHFADDLLFSPDGTQIAVAGFDNDNPGNAGYLDILNTKTGELIHEFTEQTLWEQISDRTPRLIAGNLYRFAPIRNIAQKKTNKFFERFAPGNSGLPTSLAWSPDSKTLAAAYADGSLKLWRVKD